MYFTAEDLRGVAHNARNKHVHMRIQGCTRDTNTITVDDLDIVSNDYLPTNIGVGRGEMIDITIDVDTGTIVGWNSELIKARLQQIKEEHCDET